MFPLSMQHVEEKMAEENILTFQENGGVQVYITNDTSIYNIHIFSPSMVLDRFSLHVNSEFSGTFVTAVPGRSRYYVVEIEGESIEFIQSSEFRIRWQHIVAFLSFVISTMSVEHKLYKFYAKKMENGKE